MATEAQRAATAAVFARGAGPGREYGSGFRTGYRASESYLIWSPNWAPTDSWLEGWARGRSLRLRERGLGLNPSPGYLVEFGLDGDYFAGEEVLEEIARGGR